MNKQIIVMSVFERDEMWEHEYLYNLSDNQIILTVYLKGDLKVRSLNVIPSADL